MFDPQMSLTQRQQLRLNLKLIQTMDTLALSTEELKEKIRSEAEINPTMIVKEASPSLNVFSDQYRLTTDKRESYSDSNDYQDNEDTPNWIEGTVRSKESLPDHLLKQLGFLNLDENIEKSAEIIITSLDKNGFTGPEPEKLLPPSLYQYFNQALKVVQSLEPVGVGAKDWKDSLMIQLKASNVGDSELKLFHKLIYKELDNIKSGKMEAIAKDLKTDTEDVSSMLTLIRTLTPFPGLMYSTEYESYIIPELSIKKEDGVLRLRIDKNALPSVEIDPVYKEMQKELKGKKENKDASKYLQEQLQNAENLINQLEIRASTLEKTGAVLMEKQHDFFLYGTLFLKGMTMREVADEIGVHEATISRIASAKYIDTDFGIYPIRYLFSSSTRSDDGEDMSKNAIKEMLRQMIEENTSSKALSDQKLSDMLAEKGIKIARRTVAKYRKELQIDSSFERSN